MAHTTNVSIPLTVWANDTLYLHVWFSEDSTNGSDGAFVLIDSVPILPTPHAQRAAVADFATTANGLAPGVDLNVDGDVLATNIKLAGELATSGIVSDDDFSIATVDSVLDQSTDTQAGDTPTGNAIDVISAWQSFTANVSGRLEQIEAPINPAALATEVTPTFEIYMGEGNGGTLLVSFLPDTALAAGESSVTLPSDTPVTLVDGNVYTLYVTTPDLFTWDFEENTTYTEGTSDLGGDNDYLLKTYVGQPTRFFLDEESGNIGIGTNNPLVALEVAGGIKSEILQATIGITSDSVVANTVNSSNFTGNGGNLTNLNGAQIQTSSIPSSALASAAADDADADPANELLTGALLSGNNLELTDAGGTTIVSLSSLVNDADSSTTNELITNVSRLGNSLVIEDAGSARIVDIVTSSKASDGSPADAVSVDADGNVGIGVTAPSTTLHVTKSASGV